MKLLHLANVNSTNVGNGALIIGTERIISDDFDEDVEFVREPWDDYTFGKKFFDQDFVNLVNNSDGLIVGGAVTLNGRVYLTNAGMRFDLPYELWPKFEKPIIFYGLSYRVWPEQKYHHLDKFKKAMDFILNSPKMIFGVRNDGTKPFIESLLGYSSDRIIEIPDPGMFVTSEDIDPPEFESDQPNVIVSLNDEDEVFRYGGGLREQAWKYLRPVVGEKFLISTWSRVPGWRKKKAEFLQRLSDAMEQLAEERDINILLCPHYFDDYKIMSQFISIAPLSFPHQRFVSAGLVKVPMTPYFYGRYSKADLAISMRVHSMSPSIGLGTPLIALVSQDRMTDFISEIGLNDFTVDIFDQDLTQKVYQKAIRALDDPESVRSRLEAARSLERQKIKDFNQQVSKLLSEG